MTNIVRYRHNYNQTSRSQCPGYDSFTFQKKVGPAFSNEATAERAGFQTKKRFRASGARVAGNRPFDALLVVKTEKHGPGSGLPILLEHEAYVWVATDWVELFSISDNPENISDQNIQAPGNNHPVIQRKNNTENTGIQSYMMYGMSEPLVAEQVAANAGESKFDPLLIVKLYVPVLLRLPQGHPHFVQICAFTDLLFRKRVMNKIEPDGFVNLMARLLREDFFDWPKVWKELQRLKIAEKGGNYIPGFRSFGYRLCADYQKQKHQLLTFEDRRTAKRFRDIERKQADTKVMKHLRVQLARVTVDRTDIEELCPNWETRQHWETHLQIIMDKEFRLTADPFSARIHTNLTNLYKGARGLLRCDGERLGETDIKNSQPLFLSLAGALAGYRDEHFIEKCEAGILYDWIGERLGLMRATVKEEMMPVLFGKNSYPSTVKAFFVREFPTISAYMHKMKVKDKNILAKKLQQAEKRFIVDTVCDRMRKEHPGVFLVTIHDSVMAKRSECPIVLNIMREEFAALGMNPKLNWE